MPSTTIYMYYRPGWDRATEQRVGGYGEVSYGLRSWPSSSSRIFVFDHQFAEDQCHQCGAEAWRDEADVGVGIIYGPWGCPCGWSESDEYDHSCGETGLDEAGAFTDQYGVRYPAANPVARAARIAAGSDEPLGFVLGDEKYRPAGPPTFRCIMCDKMNLTLDQANDLEKLCSDPECRLGME